MHWEVMDMTALTFDDSSFDAVIDKAAMDALMCDEQDVWNPSLKVLQCALNCEHDPHYRAVIMCRSL
jgi:hypothetical protein